MSSAINYNLIIAVTALGNFSRLWYNVVYGSSGVTRAFTGGRVAYSGDQSTKKTRKIGETNRRMGKCEEMFLACLPKVESLAALLHGSELRTINKNNPKN